MLIFKIKDFSFSGWHASREYFSTKGVQYLQGGEFSFHLNFVDRGIGVDAKGGAGVDAPTGLPSQTDMRANEQGAAYLFVLQPSTADIVEDTATKVIAFVKPYLKKVVGKLGESYKEGTWYSYGFF